ncbi:MAG: peptidoglycan DD-metalloendopeptidase family protein, partial [Thermoleophilaceae bacterium]
GHPGSRVVMQSDGNLVVYSSGRALWASNTAVVKPSVPSTLTAGQQLRAGELIRSASGRFRAVMQGDGNFVVYDGSTALWSSRTNGHPGSRVVMQGDGNLVVYSKGGRALWSSRTNGHPGSRVVMQSDGNLVVYRGKKPLWASKQQRLPRYSSPEWLPIRKGTIGCAFRSPGRCGGYHTWWAIDFGAPRGRPVYAAGSGKVRIGGRSNRCAPYSRSLGNWVVVRHGRGVSSRYAHLSKITVRNGDWVSRNTIIGRVGNTGDSQPCRFTHLHYEKRLRGRPLDPGPLKACHGSRLVRYPVRGRSWRGHPAHRASVWSTGTHCAR